MIMTEIYCMELVHQNKKGAATDVEHNPCCRAGNIWLEKMTEENVVKERGNEDSPKHRPLPDG